MKSYVLAIINISEQPFVIEQLTKSRLQWEPYNEHIFVTKITGKIEIEQRIKCLTGLMLTVYGVFFNPMTQLFQETFENEF